METVVKPAVNRTGWAAQALVFRRSQRPRMELCPGESTLSAAYGAHIMEFRPGRGFAKYEAGFAHGVIHRGAGMNVLEEDITRFREDVAAAARHNREIRMFAQWYLPA